MYTMLIKYQRQQIFIARKKTTTGFASLITYVNDQRVTIIKHRLGFLCMQLSSIIIIYACFYHFITMSKPTELNVAEKCNIYDYVNM